MGRALSASLALNAPASFFFLWDEVLPVMRKTGRWEQAPFLSKLCWPVFALVQDKERLSRKRQPCSQLLPISVGTSSLHELIRA